MLHAVRSLWVVVLLPVVATAQPLPPGEWLAHLGRDYPLSAQASVRNADAEITLLLMQAAARVQPGLADAWYWQADMLTALDRPSDARAALGEYVKRASDDVVTALKWIELSMDTLQTSEERAELCRSLLRDNARFPKEVRSDLHRRLAEFHWNRGERQQAQEQAQAAEEDYAFNFAALQVLEETQNVPPLDRTLRWALAGMRMNPADAARAGVISDLLTSWGMTERARLWYEHADRLHELIAGKQSPGTQPAAASRPVAGTQPAPRDVAAMVDKFPRAVLDYPFNPSKYLSIAWQVQKQELAPGDPWRCTVRLKNIGPFSITFGPERMLVPELLCSITTRGDMERTSGPTIRLSLNKKLRLVPGESIEGTWTLDLGPIRASMIGTPQQAHDVEVKGVLSPVRLVLADGREAWVPGIGGMMAPLLRFRRTAFTATLEQVRDLIRKSQSDRAEDRIAGLELLAMLLAEQQHLAAGRLRYSARRIDPASIQQAVLARATDADWQVRARLAECMRWFALDKAATQAATGLLNDGHWLVRGLALRLLADQHREKSLPILRSMAESDPDEWVKQMARALAERLTPAATQPATTQDPGTQPE